MDKTNAKVFWATIAFAVAIIAAGSISTAMAPASTGSGVPAAESQQQSIDFRNGTSVHVEVVSD